MSLKFIFFHAVINLLIHTFSVESVQSTDGRYQACNPRNCGTGPNITYPFQIIDQNATFCGYPGFEITCEDRNPIYTTPLSKYIIEDIFYQNHSLRLVNVEVTNATTCPFPQNSFSFDHSSLDFGPNVVNLYLFYHCNDTFFPRDYTKTLIPCASNATDHSFAVLGSGVDENQINCSAMPCESCVVAPVDLVGEQRNGTVDYITKVLKNGFTLEWSSAISCTECERSGGHSGFNNTQIICFCLDGDHPIHCKDGRRNLKLILGTVIPGAVIIFSVILVVGLRNKWNYVSSYFLSKKTSSDPSDFEGGSGYFGVPVFSYTELEEATKNFDPTKELGDGGYGTVYYGKLRDGREVAVKRLYEHSYKRVEQFRNEIEILTRLRHRNLVLLYGCTSRHSRELLLVYEYIPNGTVADHLHGDRSETGSLTWPIRMNIAIETASALVYLHASDIIHRDVKTNNILLDNNFCVKVADFGLSRLFPNDVTHVSTAPQGTPGYVDPDYHQCYQLTSKSDVYSFGVVLIELISSMPAVDIGRTRDEINLANLAMNRIQKRSFKELIDPCLGLESDDTVERMTTSVAELAFRCLQLEKEMRPTMAEVLEALKDIQGDEFKNEKIEEGNDNVDNLKNVRTPPSPECEDVVLLKNTKLPSSPDCVTDKWVSRSTTPGTSG